MRRFNGSREGSSSVAVLALLTLLAAMAAGGAVLLRGSLDIVRRSEQAADRWRALEAEADRVLAALVADPTPEADSPLDPVWDVLVHPGGPGVSLALEDVSSALNPNWVATPVLEDTGLASLLASPGAAAVLRQRREDEGFSADLPGAYGDLFAEGALAAYGTAYGYANVNVADELALRRLYLLRTGDAPGADIFHATVRQLRRDRRVVQPDELRAVLGLGHDALVPVVSAQACLNVHFLAPLILEELLAYRALGVPRPREAARAILEVRSWSELSAPDLARLVGVPAGSRILQYLGVTTWFWKITAAEAGARLELVVARVPGSVGDPPRFHVVEERRGRI
jgi:hypothetical protein